MPTIPSPILCAEEVHHRHPASPEIVIDLRGSILSFLPASLTLLTGPAASGAPLLLRVLGLLERPESGEVYFESQAAGSLDEQSRLELRNRSFGFMSAEPYLLESFTVAENIAMTLFKLSTLDVESAHRRTADMLDFVDLAEVADVPITELSPFEQQRVSLARALSSSPRVLIVEDACADLSAAETRAFLAWLQEAKNLFGTAIIAHLSLLGSPPPHGREIRLEAGSIIGDSGSAHGEQAPAP